ncbi:hypothetical protein [Streptomyces sp. NPDC054765]
MLAISVKTETGPDRARPGEAELTGLLRRIGADGDRFVVAERFPEEAHMFVRTWRAGHIEVAPPDRRKRLSGTGA